MIHTKEVYCLSYFQPRPPFKMELINSLLRLITPTRAELGCLQYELLQDENSDLLIMLEKFKSANDLEEHEQQSYVKNFVKHEMDKYCEKVYWHVAHELLP